jgi:cytochrome bd-type quinol oxidase subunit 2
MFALKPNPFVSQEENDKRYHDYAQKAGARFFLLTASLLAGTACFGFGVMLLVECSDDGHWIAVITLAFAAVYVLLSFGLAVAFASALLVWSQYDLGGRQRKIAEGIALTLMIVLLVSLHIATDWREIASHYPKLRNICQ